MSALVEQLVFEDVWNGLYGESWKGLISDDAFAHPAKFSRALIRKIYDHVVDEGWANKGDSVVDPFGGVALGGFDAMRHGLNWYGCELEEKFVGLGNQNIALWNERFSRMPNWGTARLIQGDSRRLAEVLSAADCCVSSPPYAGNEKSDYLMSDDGKTRRRDEKRGFRQGHGCFRGSEGAYGSSEGQLGAMKEGDLNLAISSPPYLCDQFGGGGNKHDKVIDAMKAGYGATEGQLGAMPEGQLCVSSPPYNPPMSQDHNGSRGGQRGTTPSEKGAFVKYGVGEGQLEGLSMEGHALAVSSPPFESSTQVNNTPGDMTEGRARWEGGKNSAARVKQDYADYGDNNLGNERGETFWSASRLILEQLHQVIIPGGHAVFVVKAFVRDKKIVDFPGQWAQLCEAVGFKLLHHHRASLVEHSGTQGGFHEDKEIRVERKSFFRRLAESKGSPRIDNESVLCFERR